MKTKTQVATTAAAAMLATPDGGWPETRQAENGFRDAIWSWDLRTRRSLATRAINAALANGARVHPDRDIESTRRWARGLQ